ncbi:idhg-2 [Pristionchus pacificus]|uniref:Idhg-2 n=1 Tax=Pristionchus pacificus TaxID=54126 RepID=A0A2A6BNS5_PRIPA|nr:idhg-2 [Pristionchus pacificus]|eukprot:PDM67411.1 idhg-2 [Pristionchus pacificus]
MLSSNVISTAARRAISVASPASSAIRTHKLPGARGTLAKYGGRHTVTAMPGDGIGPEMIGHIRTIFKYCNAPVNFEEVQMTSTYQDGDMEEVIFAIERNGVAIKGNIESKFDDPAFVSRNVELRRRLDLWANVLHCVTIPTVPSRHKNIDIVLIRENTEGEYSGLEHESIPGVVESIKIVTQEKIERIARFAYEYAVLNGRKKVTAVHKANIQKLGDGLFLQIAKDMAKEYPTVEFDQMIVDNASMQCGLVGGPGLVSGMNFGDVHAVFETGTRNTGTGLVGKDVANPTAFIRAGVDMLRYLGCHKHADVISDALWEALTQQGFHTGDIGGSAKTTQVVEATIRNMERILPRYE